MYISGFVIPVPEGKQEAYRQMAADMAEMFKSAGATEIVEAWEAEIEDSQQTDFRRAVNASPGEKIVFSWMIWPGKATADRCYQAMRQDEGMPPEMPFDPKRMIW